LDIGCGKNKIAGAIGIDLNPDSSADIIHDLNKFPYPLKESEFDMIFCRNILEHLDDIPRVMDEIWRAAKGDAIVEIVAPFPSSRWFYADPTHKRAFVSKSFDFFVKASPYYGNIPVKSDFKILKIEYQKGTYRWYDRLLLRLANAYKNHYESYFMYIYQVSDIYFRLQVKGK